MITQKHLSIREARTEIKRLTNELNLYITLKNINFEKTQPGSKRIRDVVVDSSHVNLDTFLNYVSRDEEYDTKIFSLISSIYAYKKYIADELAEMSKTDEIGYIKYLKYEEKKSWSEIDRILFHSKGYSKTKYYRYKSKQKDVNSK